MSKIFVYGSLLSGMHNHNVIGRGEHALLGECTLEPSYTMVSLGSYPAVVERGNSPIVGEVYEVSDEVYQDVEYLEGYPSFYGRTKVVTPFGEADMYVLDREGRYPVVPGGNWRAFYDEATALRRQLTRKSLAG